MATVPQRVRVRKPLIVALCLPLSEEGWGVVEIQQGRQVDDYFVRRIGSDWGDGFRVEKFGQEDGYHVHLANEGHSCDCKGHLAHGHCRHVLALVTLRDRGEI